MRCPVYRRKQDNLRLLVRLLVQNTTAIRAELKDITVIRHMDAPAMGASFFISSKAFMENVVVRLVADFFVMALLDLCVYVLGDGDR